MTPHKETTINESGMTWNQRELFHTLVDDGVLEINAYTAALCQETYKV